MTTIVEPVIAARTAAEQRPDITGLLSQLDEAVAGLRKAMRINCPPGLHAVADSRLDLLVRFAAEVRTAHDNASVYTGRQNDAEVEMPARPQMYAVTADDIRRFDAAGWARGWDAGYAAASDEAIEVQS